MRWKNIRSGCETLREKNHWRLFILLLPFLHVLFKMKMQWFLLLHSNYYDAHKKVSLIQNSCQKFSKDSFLFFSVLILRIVRLLATLKAYLYCGWNKNTRLSVIQNASSVRFTLALIRHYFSLLTRPPFSLKDELQAITKLKLFQAIKFQNM